MTLEMSSLSQFEVRQASPLYTTKISAAVKNDGTVMELQSSDDHIEEAFDTFNPHINSQNELKETYSLAYILTQPKSRDSLSRKLIPRLNLGKLKIVDIKEIEMHKFKNLIKS